LEGADIVIHAHTHRPRVHHDTDGRLIVNPGETGGWTYRQPTIAVVETRPLSAEIVCLAPMPNSERRRINGSSQFR
jgi:predicted phosphodiesterase